MGSIVVIESLLNCDKTKLQWLFSLLLIVSWYAKGTMPCACLL